MTGRSPETETERTTYRMPANPNAVRFVQALETYRSPEQREKYRRYFKLDEGQYGEGDVFIGVPMDQVFALAKEFIDTPPEEIEKLLESPVHEARAGALSIMDKQGRAKKTPESRRKKLFDLYLRHTDRIDNWDLVDLGAPYVVGRYLFDKPRDVLYQLARSRSIWERRTAIVATSYFIRQGDVADTFEIAEILLGDDHDLIHKAAGGWLREAGKNDRRRLSSFLDKHATTLSRPMLRYAIEHLDGERRAHHLSLKQTTEAGQNRGGDRS